MERRDFLNTLSLTALASTVLGVRELSKKEFEYGPTHSYSDPQGKLDQYSFKKASKRYNYSETEGIEGSYVNLEDGSQAHRF